MRSVGIIAFVSFATACSPYDPDLGENPFTCGTSEPKCPDGYTCQTTTGEAPTRNICVIEGGQLIDANINAFACADDQTLEGPSKNDTINTASQTPVALRQKEIPYKGVAICPEGDKDVFAINVGVALQTIEIVVSWHDGLPISASILGVHGTPLVPATSNGERSIKAVASQLEVGTYYAQVFAGQTTQNNYDLQIVVTP
jgi:hypothetical protein